MSIFCLVKQLSTLAINIGEKVSDCLGVSSVDFPGELLAIVMGMQFMYLLGLPILLNHV